MTSGKTEFEFPAPKTTDCFPHLLSNAGPKSSGLRPMCRGRPSVGTGAHTTAVYFGRLSKVLPPRLPAKEARGLGEEGRGVGSASRHRFPNSAGQRRRRMAAEVSAYLAHSRGGLLFVGTSLAPCQRVVLSRPHTSHCRLQQSCSAERRASAEEMTSLLL